jgi:hypothetical protein
MVAARQLSGVPEVGPLVAGPRRRGAKDDEPGAEKLVLGEPGEVTGDVGGDQRLGCEVL